MNSQFCRASKPPYNRKRRPVHGQPSPTVLPHTPAVCAAPLASLSSSSRYFFNWCVLSEVGLRVDPSASSGPGGLHRFTSPSFGALFEGKAVHLDISGSPSIGSDFTGCKSSGNESAAARQPSHSQRLTLPVFVLR